MHSTWTSLLAPRCSSANRSGWLPKLLLVGLVAAWGCRAPFVGPDYCPPATPVPAAWSCNGSPVIQGSPADLCEWWRLFGDPCLVEIVDELSRQNLTLREAGHRVAESRARLGVARGELWPQSQTVDAVYAKSRISRNTANFFNAPGVFTPELSIENWRTGLSTAWELDFWGRYRRAIEAASAEVDATIAAYDDARVLLIAEAVQAYVVMRSAEQRQRLALRNAEIIAKTYDLVRTKVEAGSASAIDLAQAESNLRDVEALAPLFETQRRQAAHQLGVLLGRPPSELACGFPPTGMLPTVPYGIAVGIPCDLLRQRPDVRKAERRLAAQSARIGVAEADFYPQIGLTGTIGVEAEDFSKLFRPGSGVGVISPYFRWNILNYGRITCNVEAEKQAFLSLGAAYQNKVLDALREAEDAQVALVNGSRRVDSLQAAAEAASVAASKAEEAYNEGASDFSRVYLLQSDLVLRQDRVAVVQAALVSSVVDLYKALGGGWQCASDTRPRCAPSALFCGIEGDSSTPGIIDRSTQASMTANALFEPPAGAASQSPSPSRYVRFDLPNPLDCGAPQGNDLETSVEEPSEWIRQGPSLFDAPGTLREATKDGESRPALSPLASNRPAIQR